MEMTSEEARVLLEVNLPLVKKIVRRTIFQKGLRPPLQEDFESYVMFKLVDDNYRRMRSFRKESKLGTFLTIVVQRLYLDFLDKELGKWRSSAKAKALGPVAERLEECLVRDGMTIQEATEQLSVEAGAAFEEEEVLRLVSQLPPRVRRRRVELNDAMSVPLTAERTDVELETAARELDRLASAVRESLRELSEKDALILRMWFRDARRAKDIGRQVELTQRQVYARLARSRRGICRSLLRRGFGGDAVRKLLSSPHVHRITIFGSAAAGQKAKS